MAIDGIVSRTHNPAAQARIQTSVPAAPASIGAQPGIQNTAPALPSSRLAVPGKVIGGGQAVMGGLPGFRGAAAAQPGLMGQAAAMSRQGEPGIKQAYADSQGSMTTPTLMPSGTQYNARLAVSETTNGSP